MVSFDNIPHRVIKQGLTNVIADGKILGLIDRFLTAGVMEDGVVRSTTLGTPQGGVLSPLLANIALNFLDGHLDELGYRLVRYADDFVVLCRTEHQAKEAQLAVERFVEQLGLSLSAEKTHVTTFRKGFTFLGFDVSSYSVKMRAKSVEKFKSRIRELTVRSHNLDAERVKKLNAVVRGVVKTQSAAKQKSCAKRAFAMSAQLCKKRRLLAASDEISAQRTYDNPLTPICPLFGIFTKPGASPRNRRSEESKPA